MFSSPTSQPIAPFSAPNLPSLRWLRLAHGGKARALNAAILHVDEEIVVTVDADTLLEPGAIAAMRNAFAAEPELVAATGVIRPMCGPSLSGRLFEWFQTYEYVRNFLSRYAWERLNGLPLEERVAKGVVRSFQDMKIFMGMTCVQNLMLPATPRRDEQVFTAALRKRRSEPQRRERALRMLERLGLGGVAHKPARDLSYAEQKRLMIGRLLAADADCYLLDEPMSGLDEEGRTTIVALLRDLAATGATVCLVEHSLSVIESLCSRVAFLMDGKLVKEGPCAEILRDPELVDLYFGSQSLAAGSTEAATEQRPVIL